MSETCPTCGTPVRLVTSGEGTGHYEPLSDEKIDRLEHRLSALITATKVSESQAEAACREVIAALEPVDGIEGAQRLPIRYALAAAQKGTGE